MSKPEHETTETTTEAQPASGDGDELLYEEPPRMTARDTIGVIVALVALFVIGWVGYLWLTPGKSVADAWRFATGPADSDMAMQEMEQMPGADPEAAGEVASASRCASCGMFADKSMSHVRAQFTNDGQGDFDSWGCVFDYVEDNSVQLASAEVIDFTSSLENPHWLDAQSAAYLFGVESVTGSMPPFVAAFADEQAARSHQDEMGGELLDFAGLRAKWSAEPMQMSDGEMAHDHAEDENAAASGMDDDHDMAEMDDSPVEQAGMPETSADAATDQPHLHEHEQRCAYCGMFADRSPSHVVAYWPDGSDTHHDCWDCVFNHGADNNTEFDYALVKLYNSSLEQPEWLRADQAVYLYDTEPIRGSMPPFIAAFASRDAAEQAAGEIGGEVMNYEELVSNWE